MSVEVSDVRRTLKREVAPAGGVSTDWGLGTDAVGGTRTVTTSFTIHPTADPLDWPVRPCEPWCDHSTAGHGDEVHPQDRYCYSEYQIVPLSRHKPERWADGVWKKSCLNVLLRREYRESAPYVVVHCEETDAELCLTLDEAQILVAKLSGLLLLEANR